jgi:flagellar hook-length control protein FliK
MSAILASSAITTNSIKSSSENLIVNSSGKNIDSFNDALQSRIEQYSQETKASSNNNSPSSDATTKTDNTHLTKKSQDLLATIWNIQGTSNSTQQTLSTNYIAKDLSSSSGKIPSDALIETKPNDVLPSEQPQDLLSLIWSMQNNVNTTQQAPISTAADTTPAIINDSTALALKSAANSSFDPKYLTAAQESNNIINDANALALNSATVNISNDPKSLTAAETSSLISPALINDTIKSANLNTTSTIDNTTALVNSDISQTMVVNNPTTLPAPSPTSPASMQTTMPAYPITPSISQSGWDEAIGQRLVWMASQNIQTATLNINPEHLGPLQVQIQMDSNQQANVQFFSALPEVRLALQNSIPMLSQMLEQTGIHLGQSDVSSKNFGSNQQQQKSNPNSLHNESIKLDSENTIISNSTLNTSGNSLLNIYA